MLKRWALTVGLVGLFANGAGAQATDDLKAAFIAAIEASGCMINDDTAMSIIIAVGAAPDAAVAMFNDIRQAGEAAGATVRLIRNADGTTTLISPNCPAE